MAVDGAGYSSSEFQLAFVAESNIGTANVSSMNLINIDSVTFPSLNPTQVLNIRSGTGRVSKLASTFISEKNTMKEISFSGVADSTVLPLLLQNITTNTADGNTYDVAHNYTPPELEDGASSAITKTVTVALVSPEAGNDHSVIFPGCTLTQLTMSGDMGTESGRVMISGTFSTGFTPTYGQNKPTSMTAFGSTFYSLSDFTTTRTVASIADSIIQSFSLNLSNPSAYIGYSGANADPMSIVRATPEFEISYDASVKYDDNTAGLHTDFKDGDTVTLELANNGTFSSATGFGCKASYGKITSISMSENAAMFFDVSVKLFAHTSGDVIEIVST
tara:strand:- start:15436 stop:16434 length:999 start_codon:yes stop_codon:yes gene_type:complete